MSAALDIDVVRNVRSRRAKLSVDPASGRVRLTLPPRMALGRALNWAEEHRTWIEAQRDKLPQAQPFEPGGTLPFDDAELRIVWEEGASQRVERVGDELRLGGPRDTVSRRIHAWLRREALKLLSAETAEYAARAGVKVVRVGIGDTRSRWGSCAPDGTIRYSWRLVLAPRAVRRATVAHEVAHRVHMHHGPEFHAFVDQIYEGDADVSRLWLKRHGATLHWLGRSPA